MTTVQKKLLMSMLAIAGVLWTAAGVMQAYAGMRTPMQTETITFNSLFKMVGNDVSEYCVVSLQRNVQVVEAACSDIVKPTVANLNRRYPLIGLNVVVNGVSLNVI